MSKIPSQDIFKTLSREEQEAIAALDSIKEYKKDSYLISENERFSCSFFVVEGCVRQFSLQDGEDKTSNFYTENESIFLPATSSRTTFSKFNLQCLEDSRISVVSFEKEEEMLRRFPKFERMCRITTEESLLEFQEKFAAYMSSSPEQRYLNLLETRPDLLSRVPQYHLASYLGVKPESLSRIRKRVATKKK